MSEAEHITRALGGDWRGNLGLAPCPACQIEGRKDQRGLSLTLDVAGQRFRLVGFDTPETYDPECEYELALGNAATKRVRDLVASGQLLDLIVLPGLDKYDRGLARFYVGGKNLADILTAEGLARAYRGGRRQSWC